MTLGNMRADGVRSLDVCYIVTPIVGTPMTGRLIQWPPMAVRSPGCAGTLDSSRSCGTMGKNHNRPDTTVARWRRSHLGRVGRGSLGGNSCAVCLERSTRSGLYCHSHFKSAAGNALLNSFPNSSISTGKGTT
jgi:hypothetical protein